MAWKIERRTGGCGGCEHGFEDGERHASVLEVGEEGLLRADLCLRCFESRDGAEGPGEGPSEGDRPDATGARLFWWFTRHFENAKKAVQLDLGSLEQLFVQLEGRTELAVRELRYVLCLLLMRKRRVKVEKVVRDEEGESFLVKRPRRDERFKVYVFDFTSERMAELRDELQAIFDGAESTPGLPDTAPGGAEGEFDEARERDSGSLETGDEADEVTSEAVESEPA